jgi:hypothetical protein
MDSTSHQEAETSIESVQRYLREGLTESARLLAKRPVIVAWPEMASARLSGQRSECHDVHHSTATMEGARRLPGAMEPASRFSILARYCTARSWT